MQTKCVNCGKISPVKDDICDGCGGVQFVEHDPNATAKVSDIIEGNEKLNKKEIKAKEKEEAKKEAEAKEEEAEEETEEDEKEDE